MPEVEKPTAAKRIFSHLTPEDRIDQACDLLAIGVLRLARKRGLTKKNNKKENHKPQPPSTAGLHHRHYSNSKVTRVTAAT